MGEKRDRFVARYKGSVEAFVPFGGGAALSVYALFGHPSADQLAAGTLGILAALSFALIHEHALREETNAHLGSVDTAIGDMRTLVDATTGRIESVDGSVSRMVKLFDELSDPVPYHVLRYEAIWDLEASDGTLAKQWQRKLIEFSQNDVVSLWFWSLPTGSEDPPVLSIGKVIDHVLASDGRRRSVVSLGRFYNRGQRLQFDVERTLRDSFRQTDETVQVMTADSTNYLFLQITFPADRPPTDLQLNSGEGNTQPLSLAPVPDVNNRPYITIDIPDPPRGVTYTVSWHW